MIVLLSGGQDSTTCLYWALRAVRGTGHHIAEPPPPRVRALFIEYGQRHMRERASAIAIAREANVPLHMARVTLPFFSGLTQDSPIETMPDGLPSTFVPGRSAQFLAMAAGLAKVHGSEHVIIGCSAVDYSGYPDCRPDFILKQQAALASGLDMRLTIRTPLIDRTKAQTVRLARELGAEAWAALGRTWTCYIGGERPCGECPACVLRAKGFAEAGEEDPACPP